MFNRLTATAAAAALCLSTAFAPAPARAGDEAQRVILGIAALSALAAILHAQERQNDSREAITTGPTVHNYYGHQSQRGHVAPPRSAIVTKPRADVLPAGCLRRVQTQHGGRSFLGRRCLQQHHVNTAALPQACLRELDFGRRDVNAWNAQCLERSGYRLR